MESLDYLLRDNPVIWVFGYGSLLWKHNFCYKSKVIGYIEGYERRFNQGNETFRGIPGKPGRVANLEEKANGKTWGVAYEINGRREVSKVLQDLYVRESRCGGYDTLITTFYPREYAKPQTDDADSIDSSDSQLSRSSSSSELTSDRSPLSGDSTNDITSSSDVLPCLSHSIKEHEDSKDMDVNAGNPVSSLDRPLQRLEDQSLSVRFSEQKQDVSNSFRTEHTSSSTSCNHQSNELSVTIDEEVKQFSQTDETEDDADPKHDNQILERQNSIPVPGDFISPSKDIPVPGDFISPSKDIPVPGDFISPSKDIPAVTNNTSGQKFIADNKTSAHRPVQVLLYTATPENCLYLGSDSMSNMAHQIVDSTGTAGTNVEYVLKIAEYIRKYIPEDDDDYLFGLDAKIREELYRRINLQRTGSKVIEKDTDLEHHEALLNSISVRAS